MSRAAGVLGAAERPSSAAGRERATCGADATARAALPQTRVPDRCNATFGGVAPPRPAAPGVFMATPIVTARAGTPRASSARASRAASASDPTSSCQQGTRRLGEAIPVTPGVELVTSTITGRQRRTSARRSPRPAHCPEVRL
jgi:hypothetical protein